MGFPSVADFARSQADSGCEWTSYFFKTGSPILPAAGMCADLSMAAGIPKYNAYVGTQLEGTPFFGSGNNGIYLPRPADGQTLHVADLHVSSPSATLAPATFWLCDYLYAYPLVDMDSTDLQEMDNTVAQVPRYANGNGVMAMIVTTTPQTGVAQCNINYTNNNGVSGRSSSVFTTITNVGNIQGAKASSGAAGSQSPFIQLQGGDSGIRQIDSIQMLASAGGFCAVVLVRPLAEIKLREQNTAAEVSLLVNRKSLPRLLDGAYPNFVFSSGVAAVSSVIRGFIQLGWR